MYRNLKGIYNLRLKNNKIHLLML